MASRGSDAVARILRRRGDGFMASFAAREFSTPAPLLADSNVNSQQPCVASSRLLHDGRHVRQLPATAATKAAALGPR